MTKMREEMQTSLLAYEELIMKINDWLDKVSYREFEEAITSRVRGQKEVTTLTANVYNYMYCIANGIKPNNNVIIAAPSGCGKTETFRAIRDYFDFLQVYQVDMTMITEEGFKGRDTSYLVKNLLDHSETNGIGIIFMDELDKKVIPSYTSTGANVNGAVMAQLLTTIEGRIFEEKTNTIDTSNTLFIGLGSFDECRKRKNVRKTTMGFTKEEEKKIEHYSHISRMDMIELGASYEFIGRFAAVINYDKLSDDVVDEIIDMDIKKVASRLGYDIAISDEMRKNMHENANGKFGCRILESLLLEAVMPHYCELLRGNCDRDTTGIYINNATDVMIYTIEDDDFELPAKERIA